MGDRAVLVTGGSGFLGRHILRELTQQGERTYVLSRRNAREIDGALVVRGGLLSTPDSLPDERFHTVIHAAGLAHTVPKSPSEAWQFFAVNADGTRNLTLLLERCGRIPNSFVLVSTVAVYGLQEGIDLDESTARGAVDSYGMSKCIAEDIVLEWGARRGVTTGIVRLPLVVGPAAPGNLGRMVRALQDRRYVGIGNGHARRSMVLARDVAAVLSRIGRRGGTYHLTDGHHPSFAELEDQLCRILALSAPPRLPLPLARAAAYTGDALERLLASHMPISSPTLRKMTSTLTFTDAKAREKLDWKPKPVLHHLDEIV